MAAFCQYSSFCDPKSCTHVLMAHWGASGVANDLLLGYHLDIRRSVALWRSRNSFSSLLLYDDKSIEKDSSVARVFSFKTQSTMVFFRYLFETFVGPITTSWATRTIVTLGEGLVFWASRPKRRWKWTNSLMRWKSTTPPYFDQPITCWSCCDTKDACLFSFRMRYGAHTKPFGRGLAPNGRVVRRRSVFSLLLEKRQLQKGTAGVTLGVRAYQK